MLIVFKDNYIKVTVLWPDLATAEYVNSVSPLPKVPSSICLCEKGTETVHLLLLITPAVGCQPPKQERKAEGYLGGEKKGSGRDDQSLEKCLLEQADLRSKMSSLWRHC